MCVSKVHSIQAKFNCRGFLHRGASYVCERAGQKQREKQRVRDREVIYCGAKIFGTSLE